MAQDSWGGGGSDAEDEEWPDEEWGSKGDHVVCLVDAHAHMFERDGQGRSFFHSALHVVHRLMRCKVIQSDKDTIGVTLFGTERKTSPDSPHEHVLTAVPLDHPNATSVQHAKDLLAADADRGAAEFDGPASAPQPGTLRAALWTCQQQFILRAPSDARASKRIWLFTNDDDPTGGSQDEVERAVQVAADASDTGILIELFHMNRPDAAAAFDVGKFYRKILTPDADGFADQAHPSTSFDNLFEKCYRKLHRKRVLSRLPFVLAPSGIVNPGEAAASATTTTTTTGSAGLSAAADADTGPTTPAGQVAFRVQLVLTTSQTKLTSVKLNRKTNSAVKPVTRLLCDYTGAHLDEFDVKTYLEVGGHNERAYLRREEMKTLKAWTCAPGLAVLGFLPRAWLRPWFAVRAPYFIYPDEEGLRGSTAAFVAVHRAMIDRNQIGLARLVRNASAQPKIVALLAQEEEVDEDGTQLEPPGIHVLVLPFADDIRELPLQPPPPPPSDEAVEAAVDVVKRMDLPGEFLWEISNPTLQKQYSVVESLALDDAEAQWRDEMDELQPPPAFAQLAERIDSFAAALPAATSATKRKAEGGGGGGAAKKAKPSVADAGDVLSQYDWAGMAQDGSLAKRTMPELKAFLKAKGLPVSGKKSDLVDRATEALSSG